MIDVNKSFLTKEQSTIIKGILILLVVLGHNGILMGKAQHLSVNSFNDFLYTFHVYAFLFLPFLYNIPEQSICRIKKNFIHLYKPYTVFFIILLIAFWVINKSFDVPGVVYAYISASEPVLKQYVGASFLWFLPTMFSLLILRDSLMNTKIGLLLVSLGSFIFLVLYSVFGIIPWECNQISVMGIFTAFRIFCLAVFSRILLMLAEQDKRIKWLYIGLGVVTSVSFFLFKNLEGGAVIKRLNEFVLMPCFIVASIICMVLYMERYKISKIFIWFGKYSLEIYLFHIFIYNIIYRLFLIFDINLNFVSGICAYLLTLLITYSIIIITRNTKIYNFIFK